MLECPKESPWIGTTLFGKLYTFGASTVWKTVYKNNGANSPRWFCLFTTIAAALQYVIWGRDSKEVQYYFIGMDISLCSDEHLKVISTYYLHNLDLWFPLCRTCFLDWHSKKSADWTSTCTYKSTSLMSCFYEQCTTHFCWDSIILPGNLANAVDCHTAWHSLKHLQLYYLTTADKHLWLVPADLIIFPHYNRQVLVKKSCIKNTCDMYTHNNWKWYLC